MWLRNKLSTHPRSREIEQDIHNIDYDQAKDQRPADKFAPTSVNPCMKLPEHVKIHFVAYERDISFMVQELKDSPLIGIDSEWKPQLCKWDRLRPALLQISNLNTAFLVDLVSLANNPMLDNALCSIFRSEASTIIGFGFKSDLEVFGKCLGNMQFWKVFRNFLDAQGVFARVLDQRAQMGLTKVCKEVLGMDMCKGEQMSNWENRPLRLCQQHYGALDAYCLVIIIQKLTEVAKQKGKMNLISP